MRRKTGALVPFEKWILEAAHALNTEFYGYQLVQRLGDRAALKRGTLYRALNRLEVMGYLTSRWAEKRTPLVATTSRFG